MTTQIEQIISRAQQLKSLRLPWESHWQELLTYCNPRKATVTSKGAPGQKRMGNVYDGTAIQALDILGAGMNTFLTSRVNKWFQLETEDQDLMQFDEVVSWLQDVEKRMYRMYNKSNFYTAIHETYLDDGSIGTSILYQEEDFNDICRFYARHIGECSIAENNKGRVDTIFREFTFTVRQAIQQWGDAVGEEIKRLVEKEPDKELSFLHAVYPRENHDPRKSDNRSMPFESLYIYPDKKVVLSEGGYNEMPYMVNRWTKDANEIYGRSPAMNALPDIKMVNEMSKTTLRAAQKVVDPPMISPDDGVIGSMKLIPGGITFVRSDVLERKMEPHPMKMTGNVRLGLEMENQRRQTIKSFFFVDLFLLLMERPTMTATEVVERNEEKVAILSPVLGRIMVEKLDPVISRSFGIMSRKNLFPPPPEVLSGQKLSINYVSLLAKVQRLYEAKAIRNTLADIGPFASIMPEIWDNVDPDLLFDEIADLHGFPQRARRSAGKMQKIREGRQQVAQQETAGQDLVQGAHILASAKKAGLLEAGGPNG
jgi:hypothetical protein